MKTFEFEIAGKMLSSFSFSVVFGFYIKLSMQLNQNCSVIKLLALQLAPLAMGISLQPAIAQAESLSSKVLAQPQVIEPFTQHQTPSLIELKQKQIETTRVIKSDSITLVGANSGLQTSTPAPLYSSDADLITVGQLLAKTTTNRTQAQDLLLTAQLPTDSSSENPPQELPEAPADTSNEVTPTEPTTEPTVDSTIPESAEPTETTPPENTEVTVPPKKDDGWSFQLIPYLFLPVQATGSVKLGDEVSLPSGGSLPTLIRNIDVNLKDLFNLDKIFVLSGRFEARNNNFGIYLNGLYQNIGFTNSLGLQSAIDAEISTSLYVVDLSLGWRIASVSPVTAEADPETGKSYPTLDIELLGGVRYGNLSQSVDFSPGPDFDADFDWFEPLIGIQNRIFVSKNLSLGGRANFSGFGLGDGSSLTWEVVLDLDWRLSPGFSLRPGYRFFSIDIEREGRIGDQGLDLLSHGPWLGMVFSF